MSFVVVKNPRVWWPVIVPVLTEDGVREEQEFKMRFVLHDEEANMAIAVEVDPIVPLVDDTPAKRLDRLADGVMKLAEDWAGVMMQEGEQQISMPFTRDNIRMVIGLPNVADAVLSAYRSCRRAEPERRLGN